MITPDDLRLISSSFFYKCSTAKEEAHDGIANERLSISLRALTSSFAGQGELPNLRYQIKNKKPKIWELMAVTAADIFALVLNLRD